MATVFISYCHRDTGIAERVCSYLKRQGHAPWFAENEICVGDSISEQVARGLQKADFLLVILTRHSVASGWVKKEIESKLSEEITSGRIRVLPVLGEQPDVMWSIPELLRTKKYADITKSFEEGMHEVIKAITSHFGPPMAPKEKVAFWANIVAAAGFGKGWTHMELRVTEEVGRVAQVIRLGFETVNPGKVGLFSSLENLYCPSKKRFLACGRTLQDEGVADGDFVVLTDLEAGVVECILQLVPKPGSA